MNNNGDFPQFDLGLIEKAEEQAAEDREKALNLFPQVQKAVSFLDRVKTATREARERLREKITEAKKVLEDYLRHDVPAIRRAVWRAILGFELTRPVERRDEVEELLSNLKNRGLLQEADDGYLRAYGKNYIVHPDSGFGGLERSEAKKLLYDLLKRVKEEFSTGDLSLEELFLVGKSGECVLVVPPEKVRNGDREVWLGGGILRVKSDGECITPVDAMGGFEGGIRQAKELNVRLLVRSLTHAEPPFLKGLDSERGAKVRLLWRLIKRAERLADEKKSFSAKATVTAEEFFLERQTGVCFAELEEEPWEVRDDQVKVTARIYNMFFLVERWETEETKRILRIVAVPSHLQDFFSQCTGEYYEEGKKFEGCPHPLRTVLQAISGQVHRASRDAKKADRLTA